jgi:pyruvyl transferase EpsO
MDLPPDDRDDEHRRTLARCRDEIADVLAPLLPAGTTVALLPFANHRNAGDTAIWQGQRAVLERLGVRVGYTCAPTTLSIRALRRRVGDGPILLNGGGNLGDLYRGQQAVRERVLATCRDNPVIQLPQSIEFRHEAERDRVARLVAGHGGVTLLCRERRSLGLAQAHLGARRTAFCPDMALALAPRPRPAPPVHDVVWLARRDPEARHRAPEADELAGLDVRVADWLEPLPGEDEWPPGAEREFRRNQALVARMQRSGWAADHLWRLLDATFGPLADAWVGRAVRLLSSGRVVVTDRLHAHVLCLLHGIPSVVLDNAYGKVHGVVAASTGASPLTHPVASVEEAAATARALVSTGGVP